jgi:hypothetical protein
MPVEGRNNMQCAEFDALLSDALDRLLTGDKSESFQAHARVCAVCGPLYSEADAGRRWLKSLEEVEPPANLVHNILVATSGRESGTARAKSGQQVSWAAAVRGWLRPVFSPVFAVARQPRFAMSFGMAFFSLSVTLSLAGVKLTDLRHLDLRPAAIKRTYYETSGRVVKYYENIRLVYEIESRVREFKRATTPAEPASQPQNKEHKNNTSGQPEQRQERNYSQGPDQPVLAGLPNDPPVVMLTIYRRIA